MKFLSFIFFLLFFVLTLSCEKEKKKEDITADIIEEEFLIDLLQEKKVQDVVEKFEEIEKDVPEIMDVKEIEDKFDIKDKIEEIQDIAKEMDLIDISDVDEEGKVCKEEIKKFDFEDGNSEWKFENSEPFTGWQIQKHPENTNKGLYYGNPENWDYSSGEAANSGVALSPSIELPSDGEIFVVMDIFIDVESVYFADKFFIYVESEGEKPYLVMEKGALNLDKWNKVNVNLSAFAGKKIQLSFFFDTWDELFNDYFGVFIDNIEFYSSCEIKICTENHQCDDQLKFTDEICENKKCKYTLIKDFCEIDEECNDNDICTSDLCDENKCKNKHIEGCCKEDKDCYFSPQQCKKTSCIENKCKILWDETCEVKIPYIETFDGIEEFKEIGWKELNEKGENETNWSVSEYLKFSYSPVVENYDHKVFSPQIKIQGGTDITLTFEHYFEGWAEAEGKTELSAYVSLDGGKSFKKVWKKEVLGEDLELEDVIINVTEFIKDFEKVNVAFGIKGNSSYDISSWNIDNVKLLSGSPPLVEGIEPQKILVGEEKTLIIKASDKEGDKIIFTLGGKTPSFVSLTDNEDGTAEIKLKPKIIDIGEHKINILASDGVFTIKSTLWVKVEAKNMIKILEENFEGLKSFEDKGWSTFSDELSKENDWEYIDEGDYVYENSAHVHYTYFPIVENFTDILISPTFSAKDFKILLVTFDTIFSDYTNIAEPPDTLEVIISMDGGDNWTSLWKYEEGESSKIKIPLTNIKVDASNFAAGEENINIGFRISGGNSWNITEWAIDNVIIYGVKE